MYAINSDFFYIQLAGPDVHFLIEQFGNLNPSGHVWESKGTPKKKKKKLYSINREGNKLKEQFLLIGEGQC